MKRMKLWIDNIGIIKESEIEINGLTVITGYNNSGKTTVGKVIYSLISAVENLQKDALTDKVNYARERLQDMAAELQWLFFSQYRNGGEDTDVKDEIFTIRNITSDFPNVTGLEDLKNILQVISVHLGNARELLLSKTKLKIEKIEILNQIGNYLEVVDNISKLVSQDEELIEYANAKIDNTIKQEFNHQLLPVGFENTIGKISLKEESGVGFDVLIENNEVIRRRETYTPIFGKEVLLIDNVFILDELAEPSKAHKNNGITVLKSQKVTKKEFISRIPGKGHNSKLINELLHKDENIFEEIINRKAAKTVFDKLNMVFDDEITITNGEVICAKSKIDIRNLAMGAKMFAMLKTLLENGSIKENTVLILDEPEVHLHPEWQNILAELLVLLQNQMGVTILLTTHSSQFLMAIETFAKKYRLDGKFKVYATVKNIQDKFVTYQNVTDSLKDAYYRLAKPMFEMKSVKDEMES